jgi:hypothetical protein
LYAEPQLSSSRRGRTADLRDGDALDATQPVRRNARTVDVRGVNSKHFPASGNIPDVGVFVWRLKTYPVTGTPAYCMEEESPNCFLFSVLGNDAPLYAPGLRSPARATGKLDFPAPITRRDLESYEIGEQSEKSLSGVPYYYGEGKSIEIRVGAAKDLVRPETIVAADLSDWTYRPLPDQVAVDPVLGRIAFPPTQTRARPCGSPTITASARISAAANTTGLFLSRPITISISSAKGQNSPASARPWPSGRTTLRGMPS